MSIFLLHDTSPTQLSTLSLHDALPIYAGIHDARAANGKARNSRDGDGPVRHARHGGAERKYPGADREGIKGRVDGPGFRSHQDRKSTRLNSSHTVISYAVFCLKKKTHQ